MTQGNGPTGGPPRRENGPPGPMGDGSFKEHKRNLTLLGNQAIIAGCDMLMQSSVPQIAQSAEIVRRVMSSITVPDTPEGAFSGRLMEVDDDQERPLTVFYTKYVPGSPGQPGGLNAGIQLDERTYNLLRLPGNLEDNIVQAASLILPDLARSVVLFAAYLNTFLPPAQKVQGLPDYTDRPSNLYREAVILQLAYLDAEGQRGNTIPSLGNFDPRPEQGNDIATIDSIAQTVRGIALENDQILLAADFGLEDVRQIAPTLPPDQQGVRDFLLQEPITTDLTDWFTTAREKYTQYDLPQTIRGALAADIMQRGMSVGDIDPNELNAAVQNLMASTDRQQAVNTFLNGYGIEP